MAHHVNSVFKGVLGSPAYPCVGAKSAINRGNYCLGIYAEMAERETTRNLCADFLAVVAEEKEAKRGALDRRTFAAAFVHPTCRSVEVFHDRLWEQLRLMSEVDRTAFGWASDVSNDVQDPNFAFSFGGEAYFVIGMSPVSDRIARRFPWPLLVFNAHATLRALREAKMFERMKHVIRTRDSELEGEPNRHLFDHGVVSEASQYSGVTHKIEPSLFRFPPNTENMRAVN